MKRDVVLSIQGRQHYGSQEPETIELVTEGTMEFRDGGWDITYEESELTGLARVDGITPVEPKVGEILNAGEADAPKVTYLAAILGQLLTRDMASKVTVIDLSDASNPGFTYDGRFTVRLGANENVEYKFGMLQSAVSQLTASDAGTIDLSIDKRAHFSPG